MSPETREKLKEIVRELLERVEIPETYSEFISQSAAEKTDDKWIVFVDGLKREGAIPNIQGNTEFEAKENAWAWFHSIIDECKKPNMSAGQTLKKGDKVTYCPEYGAKEKGIVKEVRDNIAFVVYKFAGEWDRYEQYTGAATDISDLKPGWHD